MKAKRTLAALKQPAKSKPQDNYDRIIEKSFHEVKRSGSTKSDQRLAEGPTGKQIDQLGEQADQSCPPLKVSSDMVANDPRMVPGYTNLGDYVSDDVQYDFLDVQIQRYEYGKPLVKNERSLSTNMQRLHDWYLKICRDSGGGVLCM